MTTGDEALGEDIRLLGRMLGQVIRAQAKPSDHCPIWCNFGL